MIHIHRRHIEESSPRTACEPCFEPGHIQPMLAKLCKNVPSDGNYAYEFKWDGLRAIVFIKNGKVCIQSRNLLNITAQFPELQELAKSFPAGHAVLDGEIVALNERGLPSFECLQGRLGLTSPTHVRHRMLMIPITYMIFDVLYLDGTSRMNLPFSARRKELEALELNGPCWHTPLVFTGHVEDILRVSAERGLEGIVAKRLESVYEPGRRSGAWQKIKIHQRQELVIGGWLPGEGSRQGTLGSLLVGYYDRPLAEAAKLRVPQKLIFAGKAGTGFTDTTLVNLLNIMTPLRRPENPFSTKPKTKNAIFIKPELVGEFEFTEWTQQNQLRHPSFKGLKPDKDPRDVVREIPGGAEVGG